MTSHAAARAIPAPVIEEGKKSARKKRGSTRLRKNKRPPFQQQLGRVWRRAWYKTARSGTARTLMVMLGWEGTAEPGTFGSSQQLPALTPLLTDSFPPRPGIPLGVDLATNQAVCEDVHALYRNGFVNSPNEAVFGGLGTGKSSYVKLSLNRLISTGGRGVVFDRKRQEQDGREHAGEYFRMATEVGGSRIVLDQRRGRGTRINIFDPRIAARTQGEQDSVLGQDRLLKMVTAAALGSSLTARQDFALTRAHIKATREARERQRVPVLKDVIVALQCPEPADIAAALQLPPEVSAGCDTEEVATWGLDLALALSRYVGEGDLSGLIDGETAGPNGEDVDLDSPLLVFDTSGLEYGSTALAIMMAVTVAYLASVWINVHGQKTVVIEEAYSADPSGVVGETFRDLAKRIRGVGGSILSVWHHLSDVPPDSPLISLIKESELISVYRQDKTDDVEAVMQLLNWDASLRELIMCLPRGKHIRKRGSRLPTLVVEPVRTDREVYLTDTDNAIVM